MSVMRSVPVAAVLTRLDRFFVVSAGVAATWLAWLLLTDTFTVGWWGVGLLVLFWLMLAYLTLPRLHRILSYVYVPDYFIGRTRTGDGLLGDPVNLAVRGDTGALLTALADAGWRPADPVTPRTSWRTVAAVLGRRSYPTAPVSPLYLFGRRQDLAVQQEVAGNPARRHHVRFWRTPDGWLLPGGARVDWLAAATYDRTVGLSLFTLQVTHRIAADVDRERDRLVDGVTAGTAGASVETLVGFSAGYHARNGGGDSIHTDGNLPVLDLTAVSGGHSRDARWPEDAPVTAPATAPVDVAGARRPGGPGPGNHPPGAHPVRRRWMPGDPRPASIVLGVLFLLLRAGGGLLWMAEVAHLWAHLHHVLLPAGQPTLVVLGVVHVAWTLVLLGLAVLLWRGRDVARVVVECWTTLSILGTALSYHLHGTHITVHTTLLTLSLDILVLLALSARDARTWTHSRPSARRTR